MEEHGIPTIVAKRLDGSRFKMPLGKEAGLGPGHIVLDGDPMGTQRPPQQPLSTFRPMSIVAKRSPISATAELLLQLVYFLHAMY